MNYLSITLLLLLTLSACNADKKETPEVITMDPKTLRPGEIVHDTLSQKQIENIKKIQSVFAEVNPATLDETITDFKRDLNVDNEIDIWLTMADAYTKYLNSRKDKPSMLAKIDVYMLVLSRSMMPADEAIKNVDLKVLSEKEAKEVLSYYTKNTEPVKVITK